MANALAVAGKFTVSGAFQAVSGSLGPPAQVTGLSPADLTTRVAITPTLSWIASAGATGYDVYGDTSPTPTTLLASNQAGVSFVASSFTGYLTDYYWRINPKNSFGTTTGSNAKLTTIVTPTTVAGMNRFETGTSAGLITAAQLNGAGLGDGTWSILPTTAVDLAFNKSFEFNSSGLQISGGAGLSDAAGVTSMSCTNQNDTQRADILFTTTHSNVWVGFALYMASGWTASNGQNLDLLEMYGGDGVGGSDYANVNLAANYAGTAVIAVKAHTGAGKSSGLQVAANIGKWYWYTSHWDAAGLLQTVKVYDTTTTPWTLVGTQTLALNNYPCFGFRLGHVDATHGVFASPTYTYFDDICWTYDGTEPLPNIAF